MLRPYIAVIIWSLVILGLSIMPGVSLPETWVDLISVDKLAHAFVYGVLTYLGLKAISKTSSSIRQNGYLTVILLSSLYGFGLEWVQYAFFPGRYFERWDIIANIIGSFIGAYIFYFLQHRKPEAR